MEVGRKRREGNGVRRAACGFIITTILVLTCSCEEVIDIDLNYADPAFVAEAVISKDSVCSVHLTRTADYFSMEEAEFVEDAVITISDGNLSEELVYKGKGYYRGYSVIGQEGSIYEIQIQQEGKTYRGTSTMPGDVELISVHYNMSTEVSILNPFGDTVYTVSCSFYDDPAIENYYMITFTAQGKLLEERYFLMTESSANGGSFEKDGNVMNFAESIFCSAGEAEVRLYAIDQSVYDYYKQLDDILFWKRRYIPPVPYNPKSNLSNGALGCFAAWSYDSRKIIL
jgi:hypothetical protein